MLEVMDHAPACLTWRERYVLVAIADNISDKTRQGWPAFDGTDERAAKFRRRTHCSRSQFYEALQGLVDIGVVEVVVKGHYGAQAVYRIPPLAGLVPKRRRAKKKGPGNRDTTSVRETGTQLGDPLCPAGRDTTADECVPPDGTHSEGVSEGVSEGYPEPPGGLTECSLCPGNPDTTPEVVSRFPGSCVRETGTPIPYVSSKLNYLKASGGGLPSEDGEPPAVVAVVADAPPGTQQAAPAMNGQPGDLIDKQPAPAAAPVAADLTPLPAHSERQPLKHPKPPRWAPGQEGRRQTEYQRIYDTVNHLDDQHGPESADKMLRDLAEQISRADFAAHHDGWNAAVRQFGTAESRDAAGAALYQYRIAAWTVLCALNARPLSSWPSAVHGVLPPELVDDPGQAGLAAAA